MKYIIKCDAPHPKVNPTSSDKKQIEHGFWQMWRFAHLAQTEQAEFRTMQFGLNLGRTQEILGSFGGVDAWWRVFEPLATEKKWLDIIETVKTYLALLGLDEPTDEFINRV